MTDAFRWLPPAAGRRKGGIDVSSRGSRTYRALSPFSYSKEYQIPVPGAEDQRAHSVEGIWQGLKIINGMTDSSLFVNKPHKRRGEIQGHLFGKNILDYPAARKRIYVPAYVYHAVNNGLGSVKDDLERRLRNGPVVMYDFNSNGNIDDLSKPFSHAALLVQLLNVLKEAPLPPFNKRKFTYMHEQVDAVLDYRNVLPEKQKNLLDEVITFACLFSLDELRQNFALRAMATGNLSGSERLNKYSPTEKTRDAYLALRSRL
ncbi:MAG: hypothetical protein QXT19_04020 [Candidatus Woesearchaeota archaeon]